MSDARRWLRACNLYNVAETAFCFKPTIIEDTKRDIDLLKHLLLETKKKKKKILIRYSETCTFCDNFCATFF